MNLKVNPTNRLKGKVRLPGSKSYSIRAFLIAACGGRSVVRQPSDCDDAKVAMAAARALGAKISKNTKVGWSVKVSSRRPDVKRIEVNESGTVLRFILPLLALYGQKAKVTGRGSLKGRPNRHLTQALRAAGVDIKGTGVKESVPIFIKGGSIKGGDIRINGSLSSQFISALMISLPQLEKNSRILLTGRKLVSSDYITMTLSVLKRSGIKVQKCNAREYYIKGKQKFKGLRNFAVPSDYGLAAFLMAAAALTKSDVTLSGNLDDKLLQADGRILVLFRRMGINFTRTSQSLKLKGPYRLRGGDFSLKDCPDLVPIMAVMALFAGGKTRLYDIGHARAKESDRISDLRRELLKVGANVTETKDALIITPALSYASGKTLNPHNDHRLAMAFAVLGLQVAVTVKDIECTHKSYPAFVHDFKKIGVKARVSR